MRGVVDLVMSLPCLWQLGGGVLVASHNEFDDLSDLDEKNNGPGVEGVATKKAGRGTRGGFGGSRLSHLQGRDAASIPLSKSRLGATAWPLGRPCCHPSKCLSR